MRVALRGVTMMAPHPNHHTQILLNGEMLGDATWDDDIQYIHRVDIPEGLLKEGENTVSITMPGDTGASVDTVYLNWIEVGYGRVLEAVSNSLSFRARGKGKLRMKIGNLSREDVRIFDITDPLNPVEISGVSVEPDGDLYTAAFEDRAEERKTYFLLTGDQVKAPEQLAVWKPARLADPQNQADYILITAKSFESSVAPLARFHRGRGLKVKMVAVEDIYNEFNHGIFHPTAIKRFLKAAYTTWQ
jgi:hypothetical protein